MVPAAIVPLANGPQPKPPVSLPLVMKIALRSDFLLWAAMKLARNALIKTLLATPLATFRNTSEDEQARALELMRHCLPISKRAKGIWNDTVVALALCRFALEQISVPTLLISAEDDLYGTFRIARYIAAYTPHARLLSFPTGGHLLLGHQREVEVEAASFLRRLLAEQYFVA